MEDGQTIMRPKYTMKNNQPSTSSAGSSSKLGASYPWQSIFNKPQRFNRHFVIKSNEAADMRKMNIFHVNREMTRLLNGKVEKINHTSDGSLHVIVSTMEQSLEILKITTFLNEPVTVELHRNLNFSQGVISSSLLKNYSENDILEGLKDQDVTKVYRLKRKDKDTLINTNSLILTFNTADMPERVEVLCGTYERVRPYYPLPRRCFKCQKFGHVGKYCKATITVCNNCGGYEHTSDSCTNLPKCANCAEPHPASSKLCDHYLIEKETIAIKTKYCLTFREAREKVLSVRPRQDTSYASLIKKTAQKPPRQYSTIATQTTDERNISTSSTTDKGTLENQPMTDNSGEAIASQQTRSPTHSQTIIELQEPRERETKTATKRRRDTKSTSRSPQKTKERKQGPAIDIFADYNTDSDSDLPNLTQEHLNPRKSNPTTKASQSNISQKTKQEKASKEPRRDYEHDLPNLTQEHSNLRKTDYTTRASQSNLSQRTKQEKTSKEPNRDNKKKQETHNIPTKTSKKWK